MHGREGQQKWASLATLIARLENYKFKKKCQPPNFWIFQWDFLDQNSPGNDGLENRHPSALRQANFPSVERRRPGEIGAGQ
jgi:hypothetical protein